MCRADPSPVEQEFLEETLSILRRELDDERLRRAREQGRTMSLDELVDYAIGFLESAG